MEKIVEHIGKGVNRVWELDEVIYESQTPYQNMVIARTAQGVSLFFNNVR